MTGILAPNVKYYVNNRCGVAAVGGFVITRDYITGKPKNTYSDPALTVANPFKMRVGSDGAVEYTLYWDLGDSGTEYYIIETFDKTGLLLDRESPYPVTNAGGGGGDVIVQTETENFFLNEQFSFWSYGDSFDNSTLPVGETEVLDDWYFSRSNLDATILISKFTFAAGENLVPFSPPYAFRYQVTSASADTQQDFFQKFDNVQTLNNEIVTVGIWSATNNIGSSTTVVVFIVQNFGTGGSPEVETILDTYTIIDSFDFYSTTFTVPLISGFTIGDGSYIKIGYRLNPSQIQDLLITDVQNQLGNGTGINYPYTTIDLQYVKTIADRLRGYRQTQGTNIIGWDANNTLYQYLTNLNNFSNSQEFLIGWNFSANPYQMGGNINSVVNGTYIADQTILVSDGNGVVNKSGQQGSFLNLEVAITGKKFGILQIIESTMADFISNSIVSLSATISLSLGSSTFKAAIIGWNGALNQETRACVSSFNAPTVNPSLATNWTYASEILTIDATVSSTGLFKLNAQLLSGFNSYGVFVWNDSADIPVGETAYFDQISLRNSLVAGVNTLINTADVLFLCKRYYQRSYPYNVANQTNTPNNAYQCNIQSSVNDVVDNQSIFPKTTAGSGIIVVNTSQSYCQVKFEVEMFKSPFMTYYSPVNSNIYTAEIFVETTNMTLISGSLSPAITLRSSNTQQAIFANSASVLEYQANGSGGSVNISPILLVHYVADARLGV